tara:strand:- start:575 stop:1027 length:453 start_codon:yes stop_codon:yes gene_type:complete
MTTIKEILTKERDDVRTQMEITEYETQLVNCRNSEYIGTIGKRQEVFVKIIKKFPVASTGGTAFKIRTRDGNLGIFYISGNGSIELDDEISGGVGDCIRFKGTPKQQSPSRYTDDMQDGEYLKITQFNRVEILDVVRKPILDIGAESNDQ